MKLSYIASAIQPSATLGITSKAKQLKAEGKDIVSFGAGEPDFPPPENVKQAAIAAVNANDSKYSPTAGLPELRKAIVEKLQRENNLAYTPDQLLVTAGAKHALYNIMRVLLDPGDEAIVPSPYWVSYPEQVKACQAKPVFVECPKKGFHPDIDKLGAAVTSKTRLIVLNSPSNPTGAVFNEDELRAIAKLALKHELFVISDEIYEKIIYDGNRHFSIGSISPEVSKLTITINGFSKAFAMPGWRVGYAAAANTDIIRAAGRLQDQSTSNICNIAQRAALAALSGPQDFLKEKLAEFDRRRIRITELARDIFGTDIQRPEGAFYLFADVSPWLNKSFNGKKLGTSFGMADFLINEGEVAVVPGGAFGDDRFVRFSYATSMAQIEKGMEKIRKALEKLQ